MAKKKGLCLDFDGVLHSYTSGWTGADNITDPPVAGAVEAVTDYVKNFDVYVYSARSSQPNGIWAMRLWLAKHGFPVGQLKFPTSKPPTNIYMDDNGYRFEGKFPSTEVNQADFVGRQNQN